MRHLATVQMITALSPIDGADRIECAKVLGWHVVVKKDEFKVGDLCIYCEVDSLLPDVEAFSFMKDSRGKMKPIKTVKLRGQISQGICFPVDTLGTFTDFIPLAVGTDVTETMGIKKYEPDKNNSLTLRPSTKGAIKKYSWDWLYKLPLPKFISKYLYMPAGLSFPSFIPKTDETRVQTLQKLLDEYKGKKFVATEKLDGSSITVYFDKDKKLHVCSRNIDLIDRNNMFWKAVQDLDIENKLYGVVNWFDYALQGELIGPGIQGNKYGLKEYAIHWFNVIHLPSRIYLDYFELEKFMKQVGLTPVPVVETGELSNDIDGIVESSIGQSLLNNDTPREGIVVRLVDVNPLVSFKAINPEFLLKYKL